MTTVSTPPKDSTHRNPVTEIPPSMKRRLDRIDELTDLLEQQVNELVDLSWGPGDDGAINAQPLPDGTAQRIHAWINKVALASLGICEYTKDLWDPNHC